MCLADYVKSSFRRKSLKWFSPCTVVLLPVDGPRDPVFPAILYSRVVSQVLSDMLNRIFTVWWYLPVYQGMWGKKKGGDRVRLEFYWCNWQIGRIAGEKRYVSIELIELRLNLNSSEYLKHLSISWK